MSDFATGERWWESEEGRRGGDYQPGTSLYDSDKQSIFVPNNVGGNFQNNGINLSSSAINGESNPDTDFSRMGYGLDQFPDMFNLAWKNITGLRRDPEENAENYRDAEEYAKAKKTYDRQQKEKAELESKIAEKENNYLKSIGFDAEKSSNNISSDKETKDKSKTPTLTENDSRELAGSDSAEDLTDAALWGKWYGDRPNAGQQGTTYNSFEDFQFRGNNAEDWMNFMLWADSKAPGMYTDYLKNSLGDYYGFDSADEAAYADALGAYSNYYNDWVNKHTVSNMFGDLAIAQDILGTYYDEEAQYNALIDYLISQYPGATIDDVINFRTFDGEQRNVMNKMFANTALAGQRGTKVDEAKLDALGTLYDQYGIDYGLIDDQNFTAAGMDPYLDQLREWAYTQDLMSPQLYMTKNQGDISQGALAQMIMANDLGYGNNMAIDPETWEALIG